MVKNSFLRTLLSGVCCYLVYIILEGIIADAPSGITKIIGIYSFVMFLIYDIWGEKKSIGIIKMYAGIGVIVLAFTIGNDGVAVIMQEIKNGGNIFAAATSGMAFHYFFVDFVLLLCFMNKSNRGYSFLIPLVTTIVSYVISLVMTVICFIAGGISIIFYLPVVVYAIMTLRTLYAPITKNTIAAAPDPNFDPINYAVRCELNKLDVFRRREHTYVVEDPSRRNHFYSLTVYGAKFKIEKSEYSSRGEITVTGSCRHDTSIPKGEHASMRTMPGKPDAESEMYDEIQQAVNKAADGKRSYYISIELKNEWDPYHGSKPFD